VLSNFEIAVITWNLSKFSLFGFDGRRIYFLCFDEENNAFPTWKHARYAFLMFETFPINRELSFLFWFRINWKRKEGNLPF
jgi:hypothetical protein